MSPMPIRGGCEKISLQKPCFAGNTGSALWNGKTFHAAGYAEARVLGGGSWNNHPAHVRAANRNRNAPVNRNNNIGFWCVVRGAARSTPLLGAVAFWVSTDAQGML